MEYIDKRHKLNHPIIKNMEIKCKIKKQFIKHWLVQNLTFEFVVPLKIKVIWLLKIINIDWFKLNEYIFILNNYFVKKLVVH